MPELEELKAVAAGGSEGRAAYKEGREAILSDQRTAIDEALGAATQRRASGPAQDALDAIIRPVGDSAASRLAAGGAQFGKSYDALGGALDTFKSGASAAEGLAYDLAYSDAARALAERNAREREADEARAEKERLKQLELMAPLLGAQMQDEALREAQTGARSQTKEELRQIGTKALRNLEDPKERDAAITELLLATTAEEAAEVIGRYAPQALETTGGWGGSGVDAVSGAGRGMRPDTSINQGLYDQLLGDVDELYGSTIPALQAPARRIESSPWDFSQQAYLDLGGDPFRAYDLFGPDPRGGLNDRQAEEDYEFYIQTGMTPEEYDRAVREQENLADDEFDDLQAQIATSVGSSPKAVSQKAQQFGIPELDAFEAVATPDASAIITDKVGQAITALAEGTDPEVVAQAMIEAMRADLATSEQIDPAHANMIIALALEQFEAHADTYGGL